jgi:predicted transcriptional regulator
MIHEEKRRRSRLDIIVDILESSQRDVRKSRIAGLANLNYKYVMTYIDGLVNQGLLEEVGEGSYVITVKGKRFISEYGKIMNVVKSIVH